MNLNWNLILSPKKLDQVWSVACTSDVWSDSSENSYASLTAYFISKDWQLRSMILACKNLTGKHAGNALSQFLITTGTELKILKTITFISIDHAVNAKKSSTPKRATRSNSL